MRAVEKVVVLSWLGDFLGIRTGKQEFVQNKWVWDKGQISENIVWST